jgi:hypothetical protein
MMKVQLIVLKTGEQLVAEYQSQVNEFGQDGVFLKKPAILVPAGDKGIGLAPWMPYTKAQQGVFLKHEAINFMVEPVDELKNHYTGSFVGGLVVPSSEVATPQLQLAE